MRNLIYYKIKKDSIDCTPFRKLTLYDFTKHQKR